MVACVGRFHSDRGRDYTVGAPYGDCVWTVVCAWLFGLVRRGVAIAAGGDHSLALTSSGTVYAWGYNHDGQLGDGSTRNSSTPVEVSGISNVVMLAGGGFHTVALTTSGAVYAWGYNKYGQLGDGTTTNSYTPVQVSNLSGAVTVAAGVDHSIAATGGAAVWDWGNNQYGQLGNGSTSESDVPVQPTSLGSVNTQTTATYTYDGTGLRATKTVNGTTSHFAYDLSSGTPLILTDGTTDYVYGPGGLPIEQVTGSGSPIYLAQDQLGSTRLLSNSSGAVVGTYSYDPAGNITSETVTATTNLLFAGQYLDQESGLYWMQARYYDPATAQFISVDPLSTGATSPYSYASDNPVNFTDPSGALTPTAAQQCSYGNTAGCQAASAVPQYTPLNLCVRNPFAGSWNSNQSGGCRTTLSTSQAAQLIGATVVTAVGTVGTFGLGDLFIGTAAGEASLGTFEGSLNALHLALSAPFVFGGPVLFTAIGAFWGYYALTSTGHGVSHVAASWVGGCGQ